MAENKDTTQEEINEIPSPEQKELTYLCKFDENGRRGETRLGVEYSDEQKQEMFTQGFVEISEEDWNYYVGNKGMGDNGTGYVRDAKTGKPVSASAHIPTKAEKLAQLESQYNNDKAELKGYMVDAIIADDTDTVTELKQEMADLEADYEANRKEILEG